MVWADRLAAPFCCVLCGTPPPPPGAGVSCNAVRGAGCGCGCDGRSGGAAHGIAAHVKKRTSRHDVMSPDTDPL